MTPGHAAGDRPLLDTIAGQIKQFSLAASRNTGLMHLVATSAWRRARLLVLCYHGVSLADEHEWNPELYISPGTLAHRLDMLTRSGCAVLPFDDAIGGLYAGDLPDRAVTITFDDAFLDFKVQALPLLGARGFPATLFATTQRGRLDIPVVHLLSSYLFWKHQQRTLDARGIDGLDGVYQLASPADRERAVADMSRRIQQDRMSPEDEVAFARRVMDRGGIDFDRTGDTPILRLMTHDDLARVSDDGIAVELHTHRHRAPEDPDEFIEEVRLNRMAVAVMTGRTPRHLCYPNGTYRADYLPRLEAEGIETAATCDPGLASIASHPLLLPRFVDNEAGSDLRFEAWTTGVASWLPRRTRRANGIH